MIVGRKLVALAVVSCLGVAAGGCGEPSHAHAGQSLIERQEREQR